MHRWGLAAARFLDALATILAALPHLVIPHRAAEGGRQVPGDRLLKVEGGVGDLQPPDPPTTVAGATVACRGRANARRGVVAVTASAEWGGPLAAAILQVGSSRWGGGQSRSSCCLGAAEPCFSHLLVQQMKVAITVGHAQRWQSAG